MRTGRLVIGGPVERADLVETPGTDGIEDVVENVILCHPAIGLRETAGQEIHAVGCAEGQLAALCMDEAGALRGVDILKSHRGGTAGGGLRSGRVAGVEVIPGIVTDVVGTARLVDAEEIDGSTLIRQRHTDVVAVDRARPVGDAIRINLASQDTDRGGITVVRSGPDGAAGGSSSSSSSGGRGGGACDGRERQAKE